jgi:uncharacterized membrane protein SpoIIM required for sporulation/ABC-type transport system involved in multi-copper enzyme maturation permease subunit
MKRFDLAWLVAKRELIDQMRDWRILMPMIILTLFFPYLMNVAARFTINYVNQFGADLIAERLLPFLMLVVGFFPVTVSLVVALEAFVGEKERGTIEPLLSSPLEDWHLYIGKLMAGTIVPLTVSYIGIGIYMFGLYWQGIKWPAWNFIVQTLALTVAQTILMVSAAIVISTQSTSVRAANLLASFIVIPVALLIQGESALMFWGTNDVLWAAVIGVSILSALLIRLGLVHFKRESLLGREIDMLNLGWVWGTFHRAFTGSDAPAALARYLRSVWKRSRGEDAEPLTLTEALWLDWNGLLRWYRVEVFAALRGMRAAFWLTLGMGVLGAALAYLYVDANIPVTALPEETVRDAMTAIRALLLDGGGQSLSAATLFWHNIRAELIMMAAGVFSFGVLGLLLFLGNFSLVGGVLAATKLVGLSPWLVLLAGVLPHGVIELPSVILAGAAMLYLGARLVTPLEGKSISETLIVTIADVLKVFLAVCVPLLLIAGLIEANITPRILLAVLGRTLEIEP